jgi:hypothetical protein
VQKNTILDLDRPFLQLLPPNFNRMGTHFQDMLQMSCDLESDLDLEIWQGQIYNILPKNIYIFFISQEPEYMGYS